MDVMNDKILYRVIYKPNEAATAKFAYVCMAKHAVEARVLTRLACGAGIVILEVKKMRSSTRGESHAATD